MQIVVLTFQSFLNLQKESLVSKMKRRTCFPELQVVSLLFWSQWHLHFSDPGKNNFLMLTICNIAYRLQKNQCYKIYMKVRVMLGHTHIYKNLSNLDCHSDYCPDLYDFHRFLISHFSIWKNRPNVYWTELAECIKVGVQISIKHHETLSGAERNNNHFPLSNLKLFGPWSLKKLCLG